MRQTQTFGIHFISSSSRLSSSNKANEMILCAINDDECYVEDAKDENKRFHRSTQCIDHT